MQSSQGSKLKTRHAVLMALSFMAPAMALLATFSLVMVAGYTWAGVPLAYFGAGICIIITAVSFADLSKRYPQGGSIWNYSKSIFGRRFGQFPSWLYLLEILVVPAAALVPVGFFVQDWLGLPPWITIIICVVIVYLLANAGVELSFRSMAILFAVQIAILLLFAISAIVWSAKVGTFSGMAVNSLKPTGSLMGFSGILVGVAAAVYSYLGFEAPASMADEIENPEKSVPKAIIVSAIIGTLINTFMAWAFVLAIPSKGLFSLLYYVNPVPAMAGVIWQNIPPFHAGWRHLINLAGIVSGLTGALAAVTSGSRILEQLGKDEVLPKKLASVTEKGQPALAIGVIAAITVLVAELLPWETVAYLIATGAIPTFLFVNLMDFWDHRSDKLGFGGAVHHYVIPWLGVIACGYIIIVGLPATMKMVLLMWCAIGLTVIYLRSCISKNADEKKPVGGLVVSLLLLVGSIVALPIWSHYYAGGMKWWHIMAPHTGGNAFAVVLTFVLAAGFIVAAALIAKNRKGGAEK